MTPTVRRAALDTHAVTGPRRPALARALHVSSSLITKCFQPHARVLLAVLL